MVATFDDVVTTGHGQGVSTAKRNLNQREVWSESMSDADLPYAVFEELRRSWTDLAAWMARGNRQPEPSRIADQPRAEKPSRTIEPSRRSRPPRP
jgi:hypothetical protein